MTIKYYRKKGAKEATHELIIIRGEIYFVYK